MQDQYYYSHGKLLLTGEYVVLDGALAIALPTKLGQTFNVQHAGKINHNWTSYLVNKEIWHTFSFTLKDIIQPRTNKDFEQRVLQVLKIIYNQKPELFDKTYTFISTLEFNKDWGLGTSSTFINNLSKWADIDPYYLLNKTFGGSGYDIAAAQMDKPFYYKLTNQQRFTEDVDIYHALKKHIFFVYLNKKQNSRDAIQDFKQFSKNNYQKVIQNITEISLKIPTIKNLSEFEDLLQQHESLISTVTNQMTIQQRFFKDYTYGIIKSLGAWGGDYILVTVAQRDNLRYFTSKGYHTIFSYQELIL